MGRSNKEARPGQAVDGGGMVNPSMMGAGIGIRPTGPTAGSGMERAMARPMGGGAQTPAPLQAPESTEDTSGAMGQFGESIGAVMKERGIRKQAASKPKSVANKSKIKLRGPI